MMYKLIDLIGDISPASARCVFTPNVDDALASIEIGGPGERDAGALVLMPFPAALRIDEAIERAVSDFATAAGRMMPWPNGTIDPKWRASADRMLAHGQLPLPSAYSPSENIKHLSSCFGVPPVKIVFALASQADDPPSPHLDGLCRVAVWLAQRSGGRVGVLLEHRFADNPALASIDYQPLFFSLPMAGEEEEDQLTLGSPAVPETLAKQISGLPEGHSLPEGHGLPEGHSLLGKLGPQRGSGLREEKLSPFPIIGSPHPGSPGEIKLATAIAGSELNELFEFNQLVSVNGVLHYIVDVIDRRDRLIVEVDGFQYHRSRYAFSADRERDFRLHTDGYLVLRLPHHEVVADVDAALDKIRRCVNYLRRKREV